MKIIIAGIGELGSHLTRLLSYEALDITLIDNDPKALVYAKSHFDLKAMEGDCTSIRVLENAQVSKTDLLIATCPHESVNITACVLAKQMGAKQTIARIYNTEYLEETNKSIFQNFGIDTLISLEKRAAQEIKELIRQTAFDDIFEFEAGALQMIGVYLTSKSKIINQSVKEVGLHNPNLHFSPIALKRSGGQKTIIPHGHTRFKAGDQVYFITPKNGIQKITAAIGKVSQNIENVMILGGGKLGCLTAKNLSEQGLHVKLIENRKNTAESIANHLPGVLVLHGDGRDVDFLREEALHNMDAFIAVTNESETNIMTCLVAKEWGVKKSIASVENFGYYQLSHTAGIDTIINKKTLAANEIFKYIRKGKIKAVSTLINTNAQILEFGVGLHSKLCHQQIKTLNLPKEAVIGGIIRNHHGIIPLGDFEIFPEDRLVICCLPSAIKRIESLFQ